MLRKLIFVLLLFSMLIAFTGCVPCEPPALSSVPVNLYPQHRDWWCWAASTEMISNYYGRRVLQPDSANFVHGQPPDCWQGCNCWGYPWGANIQEIKDNWDHWDFTYTYEASSLSWDKLKSTVSNTAGCGKSPVMVFWSWTGGGGHVVVAYGYTETNVGKFVSYRDPWQPDFISTTDVTYCPSQTGGGDYIMTYQAFVNDGNHNWGNSIHHFRYSPPEED